MKKIAFALLALASTGLIRPLQARDENGQRSVRTQRTTKTIVKQKERRQVTTHYQRMGIHTVPQRSANHPSLRESPERSRVTLPRSGPALRHDPHTLPMERKAMASIEVHNHFRAVMSDRALLADIGRMHREERVAGHYYWHRWNDLDYCHYYDRWGYHWYGWYLGPRFLWVRSFGGRWWWYDGEATRWCFWFNGDWWWPDPVRHDVVYVYRDGKYVSNDNDDDGMSPPPPSDNSPLPEATLSPTPGTGGTAPYIDPKDMPPAPEELPPLPAPEKT